MGADLYLNSLYEVNSARFRPLFQEAVAHRDKIIARAGHKAPGVKAAQKLVDKNYSAMYAEGYFRDRYNSFGLFAQLGISWWRDVTPLLDADGNLSIVHAKSLRERVAKTPLNLGPEVIDAAVNDMDAYPFKDKKEVAALAEAQKALTEGQQAKVRKSLKSYQKWRKELLDLLDKSIELNEPIHCSL